jgi:hypothetical protein
MLTTLILNSEELTQLNYERYHYPCAIVQKRLHSIYIKASVYLSNKEVSQITLILIAWASGLLFIYRKASMDMQNRTLSQEKFIAQLKKHDLQDIHDFV